MAPMSESYASVWAIDERDFPENAGAAQQLRFALGYAILAPSGHNGQPWRFEIEDDVLRVYADRSRALPTIDPHDRELLISCAAAVQLTRVALEHFGYLPQVHLLPDPGDGDLLATIRLGRRGEPPGTRDLFDAVITRHSNRHAYQTRPVPSDQLARLGAAAHAESAWLQPITDRAAITAGADLIAEGDRIKWAENVFRHELAERMIPNRGPRRDGMPGYAFGAYGPLARLAPFVVRHVDLGPLRARSDRALALATPVLAVIGTDRDDPATWMAAGQAMSHVLLRATADGLATSFLSQPIEVDDLRPRLAALLGHDGYPQLLLRVGYPRRESRAAPRRPLRDVLTCADADALAQATTVRDPQNGTRR
jgi:nitroreductase